MLKSSFSSTGLGVWSHLFLSYHHQCNTRQTALRGAYSTGKTVPAKEGCGHEGKTLSGTSHKGPSSNTLVHHPCCGGLILLFTIAGRYALLSFSTQAQGGLQRVPALQHIAPYGISAGQKMDHHGHHLKGWASELSCLGGLDAFKVVMIASISHSKARQGSRGMVSCESHEVVKASLHTDLLAQRHLD
eukprot:1159376-Pelagomonas_calceolata.AAC.7